MKRNPYYLPIPRKPMESELLQSAYKDIRQCTGSRKAMVNYITDIGGYSDRGFRSAIEFNIKVYSADLSADHLFGEYLAPTLGDLPPERIAAIKAAICRNAEAMPNLFELACESAWQGWTGSDFLQCMVDGSEVRWDYQVYGRQGGHLCLTECEGMSLQMWNIDLEELLNRKECGTYEVPAAQVVKLFLLCVTLKHTLSSQAIAREVEYQAAQVLLYGIDGDADPTPQT